MSQSISNRMRNVPGPGDLSPLIEWWWAGLMIGFADEVAALEAEVEALRCPDTLTAGALAKMIDDQRIPSPWRDAGIRLMAFGDRKSVV